MLGLFIARWPLLAAIPMTAPGPRRPLAGTFVDAGAHAPVVLIIPGSGPTDRDGNNPLGVDRRALSHARRSAGRERRVDACGSTSAGMFGSKAAIADANKVTIGDYAADAHSWVAAIRKRTGAQCVWLLGHSEGALVALAAAQQPTAICGVILVSGAGPEARRRDPRAAARQSGERAGARRCDGGARRAGGREECRRNRHASAPCSGCSRRRCRTS